MAIRSLSLAAHMAALASLALAAACSQEATTTAEQATSPEAAGEAVAATKMTHPKVHNFTLANYDGEPVELYAQDDASAIVIVMQGVGCPINQKMMPTVKDAAAGYAEKGVKFYLLNSNFQDTPEKMAAEAAKFEIPIPILKDQDQAVGKELGAVRTAETFVIDPKSWTVVYHGPFDDRLTYGREKAVASNNFVTDVLDAVIAGEDNLPHQEPQQADGCLINFV